VSYSLEATRRRLPFWYLAVPAAALCTWLLPYPWLLTDLRYWFLFPVWIGAAHVLTSASHAWMAGSFRKGMAFFRGTALAYGPCRSGIHLQAAMLIALGEELLFREVVLWPLLEVTGSGAVAVLVSSFLFSIAHHRPGRRFSWRVHTDLFLLGVMSALLTLGFRSLYPAILIHGWRNYLLRCLLVSKAELDAWRAGRA